MSDFPKLVGAFIHHCGALELLTNNSIKALGTDDLLASDAIKAPFAKRIRLLRGLLEGRSELPPEDIKSLCDELTEIIKRRNAVAHNPIVRKAPDKPETECVLLVRHGPGDAKVKEEIGREELRVLVKRSHHALERFSELLPESTEA